MKLLIILVVTLMMTGGCATIVKGTKQDLSVKTKPAGLLAKIDTSQCTTPCTLKDISHKSENITIEYKGKDTTYPLNRSFNFGWVVVGNIWNLPWGMIIDFASGASSDVLPADIIVEDDFV